MLLVGTICRISDIPYAPFSPLQKIKQLSTNIKYENFELSLLNLIPIPDRPLVDIKWVYLPKSHIMKI